MHSSIFCQVFFTFLCWVVIYLKIASVLFVDFVAYFIGDIRANDLLVCQVCLKYIDI